MSAFPLDQPHQGVAPQGFFPGESQQQVTLLELPREARGQGARLFSAEEGPSRQGLLVSGLTEDVRMALVSTSNQSRMLQPAPGGREF